MSIQRPPLSEFLDPIGGFYLLRAESRLSSRIHYTNEYTAMYKGRTIEQDTNNVDTDTHEIIFEVMSHDRVSKDSDIAPLKVRFKKAAQLDEYGGYYDEYTVFQNEIDTY